MSTQHKTYETTYIVNASMEDTQIEAAISHVAEIIERNGGTIVATNRWGRKRMAYAIDKKNNGYYVNVEFTGTGTLITQLERSYLLDENILRFLTIQLDKRALKAREKSLTDIPPEPKPESAPKQEPSSEQEKRPPLFADDEEKGKS